MQWKIKDFPSDLQKENLYDFSSKSLIFIVFSVTILGVWAQGVQIEVVLDRLADFEWGLVYLTTARILFCINMLAFLWRFVLVLRYRPCQACTDEQLPTCTVLIPAYNEGRHVADTIESVAASDYPAEKIEIISIDDGSADDTWQWIQIAAAKFPGRVTPVRLKRNCGKRRALYEGFIRSKADIFVTIDSDSLVEKDTIRNCSARSYSSKTSAQ